MINNKISFFLLVFLFCTLLEADAKTCKICNIQLQDNSDYCSNCLSSMPESILNEQKESSEESSSIESKVKQNTSAIVMGPKIYEGEVIEVSNNVVTFKATTGQIFLFEPLKDGCRLPEVGWLLRSQLIPVKKSNDKRILTKIGKIGYKPIKKYSKIYGDK